MSKKQLKEKYPLRSLFLSDYLKDKLLDDRSKLALLEKDFQQADHLVLVYSVKKPVIEPTEEEVVPFSVYYTNAKLKKALLSRIQSDELFYSTELVQIEGTKDIFDYYDGVSDVDLGSRVDVQLVEPKYPIKKLFENFRKE